MMRNYSIIILYALACGSVVQADDREKTLFAAASQGQPRWQQTSTGIQPSDHTRPALDNRWILEQDVASYSGRILANAGVYAPAANLLGETISLAASDRRYHLNDSKTMGLLLRDSISSKRAVLIEFRKTW